MANIARQTALNASALSTSAQTIDAITFYAFHSDKSLEISLQDAASRVAFAESVDASGPTRGATASLTDLVVTGVREDNGTLLDGQTLDTHAGSNSLDSTIQTLTLNISEQKSDGYLFPQNISLENFDRLEIFDGSASTAALNVDFRAPFDGVTFTKSQSYALQQVATGSGSDTVFVSTLSAHELDSLPELAGEKVSALHVNTGEGNDSIYAHIQQADLTIQAGSGIDYVDLSFTRAVAEHNASNEGSIAHGATVTLGQDRGTINLVNGNLVSYDDSSHANALASINASLVTLTDFTAGERKLAFNAGTYKPEAVSILADDAFKSAVDLVDALQIGAKATIDFTKAVVFHFQGDTYVYGNSTTADTITSNDSLIKLVGSQDLVDVAISTWVGDRGGPGIPGVSV